jgi:hypothetical protein
VLGRVKAERSIRSPLAQLNLKLGWAKARIFSFN